MPAANVIQLRAILSEKFPGLRMRLDEPRASEHKCQASGLPQIDGPLRGGFRKGALNEIIVSGQNCGSSTLIRALLQQIAQAHKIIALIDGNDSFEVAQLDQPVLSRLLWIRCRTVAQAVKAADLVLRDSNLPLVLFDLGFNPECRLRKISAATWYRFQRLVEETGTACLIFTPRQMLAPAQTRIILRPQFSLNALDRDADDLLSELKMEASNPHDHAQMELPKINA